MTYIPMNFVDFILFILFLLTKKIRRCIHNADGIKCIFKWEKSNIEHA
jgi:hypothetical protein